MCVPYLSARQGDEMPFSHPVHVPVRCNRFVVGLGCYTVLQWAEGIYQGTVCEVFVLRILSIALGFIVYCKVKLGKLPPLAYSIITIWHIFQYDIYIILGSILYKL